MIITSLLDTDLYKFTMQQVAFNRSQSDIAEYRLFNRSGEPISPHLEEIKKEIASFQSLKFTEEEVDFLSSLGYFSQDYLDYLKDLELTKVEVSYLGEEIIVKGGLLEATMFEIPVLAIIQEILQKNKVLDENLAFSKLDEKIKKLASKNIKVIEFGTRRRFSKNWHYKVFEKLLAENVVVGTSNVYLSFKHNLKPIGTMAHEFFQTHQALTDLESSQRMALQVWKDVFGNELDIALTDIFNTNKFIEDYKKTGLNYSGFRHDSGDPFEWGRKVRRELGGDKKLIFSDNLNIDKIIELEKEFPNSSYGVGTNLTNDVGHKPISLVMKIVAMNKKFTIKHSDEPSKITCIDKEVITKTKKMLQDYL